MGERFNEEGLVTTYELGLTRDDRGLWSGSQVYYCPKERLAELAPAHRSVHPDYPWLTLETLRVTGEEGRWLRLDASYAGVLNFTTDDGDADEGATYSLDITLSEEPLETHPRYADLAADEVQVAVSLARNPSMDENNQPVQPDTSEWPELQLELYDFVRTGFESYRDGKVTWTRNWVSDERPSNLNEVGDIYEPRGNPPAVAAGRNWLFVGLRSLERGGVFENSEVGELSGRGGWNEVIYSS